MTGQQVYDYVLSVFKRTDKSAEVYDAILDTIMDMRLHFNSEDFKYESSAQVFNIGDYKISLPADFGHLIGNITPKDTASDISYQPLIKISKQRYDEKYFRRIIDTIPNRLNGIPIEFCIFGQEIFIGPPVDKATYKFQINYTTENATAITASTADVPFSDRHRKTIRYGAIKELYIMLENYTEAEAWSNLYEADILKIIKNDMENISDNDVIEYSGV